MKPFNFAEAKIVERDYRRRYVHAKLRGVAVLLAVSLVVSVSSFVLRTAYARPLDRAKHELTRMESRCKNASQEIAAVNEGSTERRWHEDLSRSSKNVLGIATSVLRCVPDDVWLSRIQSVENGTQIRIEGCSATFASLSEMINSLRRIPALSAVRIVSTRAVGTPGGEPVDFSVQIRIKGTDAPAPTPAGAAAPAPAHVPQVGGSF